MNETIHEQYSHCIHYMDYDAYENFRDNVKDDNKLIEEYNKFMNHYIRVFYVDYTRYKIVEN